MTLTIDCTRGDDFEFIWRSAMLGGLTFDPVGGTDKIVLSGDPVALRLLSDLRDALIQNRALIDLERESEKDIGVHYSPRPMAVRNLDDVRVIA